MSGVFDAYDLSDFISATREVAQDYWAESALRRLSTRAIPSEVLGSHAWLLQSDARLTWISWYVDALIEKQKYVKDERLGYAHLYEALRTELLLRYADAPQDEVGQAATHLAELVWSDVAARRQSGRTRIPPAIREELWFSREPDPRCYLCGYRFDAYARDKYLSRPAGERPDLPVLVDLTRPRGLKLRDIEVEVDHVRPVSDGGSSSAENLRLACGWCNSVKSNRHSLYASSSAPYGEVRVGQLGRVPLPQPLWVLRIVATRGRCEASDGCDARLDSAELFLAPLGRTNVLNPSNAAVYCKSHDPWKAKRYVGPSVLRSKAHR